MRVDVIGIPFCGGQDLRQVALESRRGFLKSLVDGSESDVIRFSDEFDAPGHDITLSACKLGLEGVVGKPDRMTFDLDPGEGVRWATIQEATKLVRVLLEELELRSFVKTSGGKGLHVVVPIRKQLDWDRGARCRNCSSSRAGRATASAKSSSTTCVTGSARPPPAPGRVPRSGQSVVSASCRWKYC